MEQSVAFELVNAVILLIFGFSSLLFGKVVRLRMPEFYALLFPFLWILHLSRFVHGKPSIVGTPHMLGIIAPPVLGWFEAHAAIRAIMYLLILACIIEILRREFSMKLTGWHLLFAVLSFFFIIIFMLFPYIPNFSYHLPRLPLFIWILTLTGLALSRRNLVLLSFCVLAVGSLFADFLMFAHKIETHSYWVNEIVSMQYVLVPAIQILASLMLLMSLFITKFIPPVSNDRVTRS
jgi:hypothetical protein